MAPSTCQEQDCDRVINGRGMCKMHYMRWFTAQRNANGGASLTTFHDRIKPEPGGAIPRGREWTKEELGAFWLWVKKELAL